MARVSSARDALAAELARELGMDPDDHPLPETLWEYHAGILGEAEKESIRDHLTVCPACARQLLELAGTVQPEAPEGDEAQPLSDERMAELWPRMRAALPLTAEAPVAPSAPVVPLVPRRPVLARIALPLAAGFLLVAAGFSFWVHSLLRANRELAAPQVNVAVLELRPLAERGERRGAGDEEPSVPSDAPSVSLHLNLAELDRFPAYRAELLTVSESAPVWSSDALRRNDDETFTLHFQRSFLVANSYLVRLYGLQGERRELLAEYRVDLDHHP